MSHKPNTKGIFSNKKIGIAGAGGIGSNCAAALVRSGICHIVIADFDTVSQSNLNRQFYFIDQIGKPKIEALKENIKRINPDVTYEGNICRITPNNFYTFFHQCDIVIEAFDNVDEKEWFIKEMTLQLPHTPLIATSGIGGIGNSDKIIIQKSYNLYICGDQNSDTQTAPPIAPKVGIVAMTEADLVLQLLINNNDNNSK